MKKDLIYGRAAITGVSREGLRRMSGMSRSTFERRMRDPNTLTIDELRRLDQIAHFEDAELIRLIRSRK